MPAEPAALVHGHRWAPTEDAGPFAPFMGDAEDCSDAAFREEYGGAEVDTGRCGRVALGQPLTSDVRAGDVLHVVAWHSALLSHEPGTGHMALALGDTVVWQVESPIPAAPESYDVAFPSPVDAPAGTPVTLHVRNHGNNTWNLSTFTLEETP